MALPKRKKIVPALENRIPKIFQTYLRKAPNVVCIEHSYFSLLNYISCSDKIMLSIIS